MEIVLRAVNCRVKVSQAMNYMVMVLLCDQFGSLNKEFGKCIGDRGQLSGNFEQFHRRHVAIRRSVQEADRFLMISSGALLCCEVACVILVLYSTTFYRDDTVLRDVESGLLYIAWLGFRVSCLSLVAGQAIMLNHKASVLFLFFFLFFLFRFSSSPSSSSSSSSLFSSSSSSFPSSSFFSSHLPLPLLLSLPLLSLPLLSALSPLFLLLLLLLYSSFFLFSLLLNEIKFRGVKTEALKPKVRSAL